MIKVSWTRSYIGHDKIQQMGLNTKSMLSALRIEEPQPLMKHMDYQKFFGPMVSKCPSIVDDIKNVFVIKSPMDMKINIDEAQSRVNIEKQTPDFAQLFLGNPQGKWGLHQVGAMGYLFFAEKSLMINQLPAYYDNNDYTNKTNTITASFDIGNWFRPAGKPVFQIKKDVTTIDIKEGDALLYIKFNTTEKIKLIEFDDSEFQRLAERSPEYMCGTLKDHDDNIISLKKCYDYFNRFKMKRRIMKLIKRNLI